MRSEYDPACIEPVLDTWGNWGGAATWTWSLRDRPGEDHNRWAAGRVEALLAALRPIARVREVLFDGPADATPLAEPERTWPDGVAHQEFERAVIDAVHAAPVPVATVDLTLDLHVWVRTARDAAPVRGWVRSISSASLVFDEAPYGAWMMHHTLFIDGQLHGDSNAELHRLNQPLLRDTLAAIEATLGPIIEVTGLPGVTRTGFASLT